MVYSNVTGVGAYFGSPAWNASTKPSLTDINTWCEEAASIIDAYIGNTVTTPVTDATDLKVITSISDMYVVDNINFVQGKNRIMVQANAENVPRSITHKAFYERLEMIKNGTLVLANSSYSGKSYVYSGANENDLAFVSAKDSVLW